MHTCISIPDSFFNTEDEKGNIPYFKNPWLDSVLKVHFVWDCGQLPKVEKLFQLSRIQIPFALFGANKDLNQKYKRKRKSNVGFK